MPGRHKHNPLRFRPPAEEREWLEARQEETGEPMNAILTAAVRALMGAGYRRKHEAGEPSPAHSERTHQ
jgi:hypothetical protein